MDEVELPLVRVLREMELAGVRLNHERLAEIARACATRSPTLEREIWDLAGEEFMIGSPQQLGADPVREARAVAASAAARPASRPTRACCRRSATSTRSSPRSSAGASSTSSSKTYLDVLPQLADARAADPHDVHAGGRARRAGWPRRTRTCRTSRCAPSSAARSAAASRPRPGTCCSQRRLLAGRAAGPGVHRRRAGAQGDLRPRRGRAHRDRVAGLRQGPGGARRRWTARSRR